MFKNYHKTPVKCQMNFWIRQHELITYMARKFVLIRSLCSLATAEHLSLAVASTGNIAKTKDQLSLTFSHFPSTVRIPVLHFNWHPRLAKWSSDPWETRASVSAPSASEPHRLAAFLDPSLKPTPFPPFVKPFA